MSDPIAELYEAADDHETDVLDRLRRKAGHIWEHIGCWTNGSDDQECQRCGAAFTYLEGEDETLGKPRAVESIEARLEYLRGELRAERMSYGELAELQSLADHIPAGDPELREAAGLPEDAS